MYIVTSPPKPFVKWIFWCSTSTCELVLFLPPRKMTFTLAAGICKLCLLFIFFYLCVLIFLHLRKKNNLYFLMSHLFFEIQLLQCFYYEHHFCQIVFKQFQQNCTSGSILLKDFLQQVRIQYELSSNLTEVIIYGMEGTESSPSSEFLFSSSPCTCRNKRYHWKHYGTICKIRYMCVQKLV